MDWNSLLYALGPVCFLLGIASERYFRDNSLLMDAENCRTKIRGEWFILDRVANLDPETDL